jgi:hypothetical protein
MTTLQKRSTALFSAGRSLIGDGGELRQKGLFGGHEWVVPRADCQYRRMDFAALPARQRMDAARLAVARFEPSAMARTHIAWQEGIAHYWIWVPQEDDPVRVLRWIPESLLRAPPAEGGGVRLVELHRGVEGQVWQDGVLQASQWWASPPDLSAWQHFLRASGLAPAQAPGVPPAVALGWQDEPWADARRGFSIDADGGERLAWKAALLLFVLGLGWQLSALVRWQVAAAAESRRLEATRLRVAPLLDARERAEVAVASIDSLLQVQTGVSDYELMADVAEALPDGTVLIGWNREPDKLRILVRGTETDPRRFIEGFAASPMLADLTATPTGSGSMLLDFNLPHRGTGAVGE